MRFLIVATLALAATGEESSSIDKVQTTIGKIKFSSTRNGGIARGRKMIVEHMLSKISVASAFTPEAANIVSNTIIPILQNIMTDLRDEATDDHNNINNPPGAYNPLTEWDMCSPASIQTDEDNARADMVNAFNDLKANREDLNTGLVDVCADSMTCDSKMQDRCEILRTTWNSHRSATCQIPSTQTSQRSSIESWLNTDTDYRNWLNIFTEFRHNRDECKFNYDHYAFTDELADTNQTRFESAYCNFANVRLDRCRNTHLCLVRLDAHHVQQESVMMARDLVRIQDAAALNYSICILNELVTNVTATDATNACSDLLVSDWSWHAAGSLGELAQGSLYDLTAYSMGAFPMAPDNLGESGYGHDCGAFEFFEAYALGNINGDHATALSWISQEHQLFTVYNDDSSTRIEYGHDWRDTLRVNHQCVRVPVDYCRPGTSWAGIPCEPIFKK